jgi:hypothetical protein
LAPTSGSRKPTQFVTCLTLTSCSAYLTLKLETICSSETSVDLQRTKWRYIPRDSTLLVSWLVKTATAEETGSLLISFYSISGNSWHQIWYTDVEINEEAFIWYTPLKVYRLFREIIYVFLCNGIYPQASLAFLADSFMVGLGDQKVKRSSVCNISLNIPTYTYCRVRTVDNRQFQAYLQKKNVVKEIVFKLSLIRYLYK